MAKKKAGDGASKKNVQKKKAQLVEDKTFGLKNKNKSKKVQNLVNSVERNVMNSGDQKARQQEEQRKQAKGFAKARKKQALDEQNALFGEALMAVQKKQTNQQAGKQEAQGRDGNDANEKKSTSRAMKMMFQMDAQEMDDKLREDVRADSVTILVVAVDVAVATEVCFGMCDFLCVCARTCNLLSIFLSAKLCSDTGGRY
jgi:hypothetical protein